MSRAAASGRTDQPTVTRYDADLDTFARELARWNEPRFRSDQLWTGLYPHHRALEDVTNVPKALRERLAAAFPLAFEVDAALESADGRTAKWLWRASDGLQVETVLMRYPNRATVCVSSQAGCAMGCTFCATGQAGFDRHLTTGEIVEQVMRAAQASESRVSNVVFMGMGEPLANYDAVWNAVERLHGGLGISARHITISTVGVVPGMRRLVTAPLPVTLAVSLHAPNDRLRETLVPLNRRYPLAEVLDAAAEVANSRGRRVTFEYACIAGVNDTDDLVAELGTLLQEFPAPGGAHVNLIPLNPTGAFPGAASNPTRLGRFRDRLARYGVAATVRQNRGVDIDAACGQLRARVGAPSRPRAGTTDPEPQ